MDGSGASWTRRRRARSSSSAQAAGSPPLVSLARTAAHNSANVIHVLNGNRTPADIILRAELDRLDELPHVDVTHVFSRLPVGDPAPGLRGRIGRGLLAAYLKEKAVPEDARFFVCGPDAMIDDTVAALGALGAEGERIHREYFAATAPVEAPRPVTLTAYLDGEEVTVTTDKTTTVTDALERAGCTPPTTCRTGQCSTCLAQVIEAASAMRRNDALSAGYVAGGLVLTCQGLPTTERLVVDYDVAR